MPAAHPLGASPEGAAKIALSRDARKACLGGRLPRAYQRVGRELRPGSEAASTEKRGREKVGLIEAALADPARMKRHRHDEIVGRTCVENDMMG